MDCQSQTASPKCNETNPPGTATIAKWDPFLGRQSSQTGCPKLYETDPKRTYMTSVSIIGPTTEHHDVSVVNIIRIPYFVTLNLVLVAPRESTERSA
jgi:hypothetical protein